MSQPLETSAGSSSSDALRVSGTRKELFTTFGSCSWRPVHIIQTLRPPFNLLRDTINPQIIEIVEMLTDAGQNLLGHPKYLLNSFQVDFESTQVHSLAAK